MRVGKEKTMGFLTRKPDSNDPPKDFSENPWGPKSDVLDDVAVLLNSMGKRCCRCRRVVMNEHLKEKDGKHYCPDCESK